MSTRQEHVEEQHDDEEHEGPSGEVGLEEGDHRLTTAEGYGPLRQPLSGAVPNQPVTEDADHPEQHEEQPPGHPRQPSAVTSLVTEETLQRVHKGNDEQCGRGVAMGGAHQGAQPGGAHPGDRLEGSLGSWPIEDGQVDVRDGDDDEEGHLECADVIERIPQRRGDPVDGSFETCPDPLEKATGTLVHVRERFTHPQARCLPDLGGGGDVRRWPSPPRCSEPSVQPLPPAAALGSPHRWVEPGVDQSSRWSGRLTQV